MYINRPIDVEYAVSKCCHGQPTTTAITERQRPNSNQFINYRLSLLFTLSCESTVKSFNNSAILDTCKYRYSIIELGTVRPFSNSAIRDTCKYR